MSGIRFVGVTRGQILSLTDAILMNWIHLKIDGIQLIHTKRKGCHNSSKRENPKEVAHTQNSKIRLTSLNFFLWPC